MDSLNSETSRVAVSPRDKKKLRTGKGTRSTGEARSPTGRGVDGEFSCFPFWSGWERFHLGWERPDVPRETWRVGPRGPRKA